jgi:hypothetical protein
MIKIAALLLALLATPAIASLTGMTPEVCAADEYLIGVSGRSGDWIDAIRPVCATWNPATRTAGVPRNGPSHGGRGGGEGVAICPRGSAVSGWEIRHVTRGESVFLQYVAPQCRTILSPRQIVQIGRLQFGRGNPPMPSSGPTFHGCGKGELAIGLSVAVGANYVSEVDLKCRFVADASPPPSPPVPPKVPPPAAKATQTPRPELTGTLYRDPEIAAENTEMVRLDWCREWGSACGKPAADAYCHMLGHAGSGQIQIRNNVGKTAIISSKAICSDPTCDGFRLIECVD